MKVIAGEDATRPEYILIIDRRRNDYELRINIQNSIRVPQSQPWGYRDAPPVHIDVMLVCPNCNQAARVSRSRGQMAASLLY